MSTDSQGSVAAIVVAAGVGARLGSKRPKLFVDLGGKPLVFHSLSVFETCEAIQRVVLVVPPGAESEVKAEIAEPFPLAKVGSVVPGGDLRGDSVYAGLTAIPAGTRTVLIHDGARPFVSEEIVLRVLEAADRFGAAVPGVQSSDTLKRVEDEIALATLDRSRIQQIQTPQGFHAGLIREAYERAREEGITAPDDSALVERMGTRVRVVPGSPLNFKITTPEDLDLARALLAART